MKSYFSILACLACLLGIAFAAPLNATVGGNIPGFDGTHSLQLVYGRMPGKMSKLYLWRLWKGPQGVAVNMCYDSRFEIIHHSSKDGPGDINNPPLPPNAKVYVKVDYHEREDCYYVKEDDSDPGALQCGEGDNFWLRYPLTHDPHVNDPTEICSNEGLWHRGYYVEF